MPSYYHSYGGFPPYVPVAQRRANALKQAKKLAKKGRALAPVIVNGRKIANTFWGHAWCENLEHYSDFESRLPRGRTYARNGSILDLQIEAGRVSALVSGSELYRVSIAIGEVEKKRWAEIRKKCSGKLSSLVDLLKGNLSAEVMSVITNRATGLFPAPTQIEMECSCPDWAGMCKHIAATLYGVGARLDEAPELLFLLRRVDHLDLIEEAKDASALLEAPTGTEKILDGNLSELFGIDLQEDAVPPVKKKGAKKTTPKKVIAASVEKPKRKAR